ncbi:hypothetical protein GJ496_005509 [Pomphorhynchus laevis]|nr:hypothetical protein GJ496_005509 [Pomphorhynchus laevis]
MQSTSLCKDSKFISNSKISVDHIFLSAMEAGAVNANCKVHVVPAFSNQVLDSIKNDILFNCDGKVY